MNRPFITLLLCILPFPVTLLAEDFSKNRLQPPPHESCKPLQVAQKTGEKHLFCMAKIDQKTRKTDQNPVTAKQLSLFAGDNRTTHQHHAPGNLGFTVIEYRPSDKQALIHEAFFNIPLGTFGKAPTEFTFHKLGDNNFGYILETKTNNQGIESGGIQIIGENGGKIFHQYIPTFASDFGDNADKGIAEKITYTLNILEDSAQPIFPMTITLNGQYQGIEYREQTFLLTFDVAQQKYIQPDNYPALSALF